MTCGDCGTRFRGLEPSDRVVDLTAALGHTQAQRLAAMFPTLEPEPAVDPRTAIDDEVYALLATRGDQFKARMYQQLNLRGMTCQHANDILIRLGLR